MAVGTSAVLVGLLVAAGCSQHPLETGWASPQKVQLQFYAPPGATVTVRDGLNTRSHEVAVYGSDHRLENSPEEFAVFNLATGKTYPFKYSTAEGFPGVSIYGELDVHAPQTAEAAKFVREAFVPILLPSKYYDRDEEHYYPVRGPSGVGLTELEVEHLRQGDLVTKVYFVANLENAWASLRMIDRHIDRLRSAETVLNSQLEFVDARYQTYRAESIHADPVYDTLVRYRDSSGFNEHFIELEAKRQELQDKRTTIRDQIDDLQQEKRIRTRLLDTMSIVNRQGALVLATPETQWPYHDTKEQISFARQYPGFEVGPNCDFKTGDITIPRLGDVVVVMRVGGRHMHWGDPRAELKVFNPEGEQ